MKSNHLFIVKKYNFQIINDTLYIILLLLMYHTLYDGPIIIK